MIRTATYTTIKTASILIILAMIVGCFGMTATPAFAKSKAKTLPKPAVTITTIDDISNQTTAYNVVQITNYKKYAGHINAIQIYRKAGSGKWKKIKTLKKLTLCTKFQGRSFSKYSYVDKVTKTTKKVKYQYKVTWKGSGVKYNKNYSKFSGVKAGTIGTKSFTVKLRNGVTGKIYKTSYVRYNGTYSKMAAEPPSNTGYVFSSYDVAVPIKYIKANKTITAKYAKIFTVRFVNGFSGRTIAVRKAAYNDMVEFPVPESVAGYAFDSWDHPSDMRIKDNTTITANYHKAKLLVRFISGIDSSVIGSRIAPYGGSCSVPVPPAVSGKRFKSWSNPAANSGTVTNVTDDQTIIANYVNEYTVTLIDETTGLACENIKVEEGQSLAKPNPSNPYKAESDLQIAVPDHRYDSTNPFVFERVSPSDALYNIGHDVTITIKYTPSYIINWVDSYDNSIIKTERVAYHCSGSVPPYPQHNVNGQIITASDFVGYDTASPNSWSNYKCVDDSCCDKFGSRIITMTFIYP